MTQTLVGLTVLLVLLLHPFQAFAQIVETVGSRALGMGGAFVAVANDSSATWWNPGALAAGPFLDMALGRATTRVGEAFPSFRDRASFFTVGTPPFGFSYHRLRLTAATAALPTAGGSADREDRQVPGPVRSLAATQLGATFVQSLFTGLHVGTTLKYVRGRVATALESGASTVDERLEFGDDLEGGDTEGRFDLDIGIIAVHGALRIGALVRNARAVTFGEGESELRLPRQARVGVAFDGEETTGIPVTVALDADVRTYTSGSGDRRVIALGAEHWLAARRIGLRGGGRFNTVGAQERTATAGVSVAVRSGLYVDGHVVRGGSADDRGWGIAARVSF